MPLKKYLFNFIPNDVIHLMMLIKQNQLRQNVIINKYVIYIKHLFTINIKKLIILLKDFKGGINRNIQRKPVKNFKHTGN